MVANILFSTISVSHWESILERSVHILLVDDDLASLNMYREILLGAGFQVETAPDGVSALRACRDMAPDLVLLDLMMPGMDGGQVLQHLRRDDRTKTIPVIALTGVPDWLQDHRDAATEFEGILLKPIPHHRLVEEIYRVLALTP